ncbi:MAG: acetyl-CoA hydrolase/transferase C-terminal domain-containing protein [Phycisphaerae bacterium]|nr:acetyl-CoA hydrolase/transferase C-terminal domain-containing protein [Phycisphaerae bacterium]
MTNWRTKYADRLVSAQEAVQQIKSGDRIVSAHACGEPVNLIEALVDRAAELENVRIYHLVAMGSARYAQAGMEKSFRHVTSFLGASTRKACDEGRVDFIPCFFHEVPKMFNNGVYPVDAALIQVSPPDENGECSLGVSVDYTEPAARAAKTVIAQVNKHMPRTMGAKIALADIDWLVELDQPLLELKPPQIGPVEESIGKNVAELVADGDTLQLGIGAIPDAVLRFLNNKKDLGIHSEMFSDGVVSLVEAGVVTNKRKTLNPSKFVATFLMGTKKLYDFVNNNEDLLMLPVDYVNNPYIIAQNDAMVSINSALQVDLLGQVTAETIGYRQFSGIGGQVDFIRGAAQSKGGRAIIALPSTAASGKLSRIVSRLDEGAVVTTSRCDVDYIVTEYGIAKLRGKTIQERAKALIAIAHPDFRDRLEEEAKRVKLL